ncbi:hypothetical protein HK405_013945, partial [Cladochytrium tenue]
MLVATARVSSVISSSLHSAPMARTQPVLMRYLPDGDAMPPFYLPPAADSDPAVAKPRPLSTADDDRWRLQSAALASLAGIPPSPGTNGDVTAVAQAADAALTVTSRPLHAGFDASEPLDYSFRHGVASGDPLHDSVILWTKLSSTRNESIAVTFEISLSPGGRDTSQPAAPPVGLGPVILSGVVVTGPEADFTIKVDVVGLAPRTTYFYRFSVTVPTDLEEWDQNDAGSHAPGHGDGSLFMTITSPTGMTTTLPAPDDTSVAEVRLGVVSCSNLPFGFFHAYARLALRSDLDAIVHLGDYIYEYRNGEYGDGTDIGRVPLPDHELRSLVDYRVRHAQYKEDPDLQALHQVKPWIVVWDDHEFVDNVAGGEEHEWKIGERMPGAMQAYFEYLPIREPMTRTGTRRFVLGADNDADFAEVEGSTMQEPNSSLDDGETGGAPDRPPSPYPSIHPPIYRSFAFGTLLDLIMLDTRIHGREESGPADAAREAAAGRSLLGARQERWLQKRLDASAARGAAWRVLGNQVVFAPLDRWGLRLNADAWDGYPANRRRVLEHVRDRGLQDVVVLTG